MSVRRQDKDNQAKELKEVKENTLQNTSDLDKLIQELNIPDDPPPLQRKTPSPASATMLFYPAEGRAEKRT